MAFPAPLLCENVDIPHKQRFSEANVPAPAALPKKWPGSSGSFSAVPACASRQFRGSSPIPNILAVYYAADGGKVFISGGKFQSAPKKGTVPAEYTTLNLKDNTGASIEVTGGEFVNFNPGAITFEPGVTSFVKAGYKSTLKQYSTTDYIVVAE
jgi:hypothetical protein